MAHNVTREEYEARVMEGDRRFKAIETKIDRIVKNVECIPGMSKDIAETREIVEAWSAAKNVAHFIKWVSGIAAGVAALWLVFKAVARGLLS